MARALLPIWRVRKRFHTDERRAPPTLRNPTQGWYSNHSSWPTGYAPQTTFYVTGQTWQQVLNANSKSGGSGQLGQQFIEAKLNLASGASTTPAVSAATATAEQFYATSSPKTKLTKAQENALKALIPVLDSYNQGLTGPGHCA